MNINHSHSRATSSNGRFSLLLPLTLLIIGIIFVTLSESDYGRALPGDLGDARFNLVILEHLFRWAHGLDRYLWSPDFFYPYRGSLSFSDNHFGTAIVYILPRLLGLDAERAFIVWFSVGALLNYACCYYALRKFSLLPSGSAVGAFIFAFALNTTSQVGHAQLGYRFAVPLAIVALMRLLRGIGSRELLKLAVLVTIQFLCSIYIGYFLTILILGFIFADYLVRTDSGSHNKFHTALLTTLKGVIKGQDYLTLAGLALCVAALCFLFFPYLYYSHLYGFHRDTNEILNMLPRPLSYLLAERSPIWRGLDQHISDIPMRWEHQMFFGGSAITLALWGGAKLDKRFHKLAALSLLFLFVLTIDIHGYSLYRLFVHFPLANAIRAVTRIGLIMLFPLALLSGLGFERLVTTIGRHRATALTVASCLLAFMVAEYVTCSRYAVPIKSIDERMSMLTSQIPANLAKDAILYVPDQPLQLQIYTEIDGMRLSQILNRDTLNGYSGNVFPDTFLPLADSCDKANLRLANYAQFAKIDESAFTALVNRLFIVGGTNPCAAQPSLLKRTHFSGALPASEMNSIIISIPSMAKMDKQLSVTFDLHNKSQSLLASVSDDNHPVRISWRFVRENSSVGPYDLWDTRADLTSDLPSGADMPLKMLVEVPTTPGSYRLEASVVQEGVVWFHSSGAPIAVALNTIVVKPDGSFFIAPGLEPPEKD